MTELVDKIKERLESSGFNCEFDDTIWIKDFQQVVQGGTLIVNGQPIQQESSYRNITMIFEICYECDIKDADTGKDVQGKQISSWEMGKRYTYRLYYSSDTADKDKIYFAPSTQDWQDVDVIVVPL